MRNYPSVSNTEGQGIGPRKTLFVMVTVVGCIAILWPKVFYPMMAGVAPKQNPIKDHRGSGLRQERPPHLRPDAIHPAMRERGRAIPTTPTVPIVERSKSSPPPRVVEGRPGPIPGMRPPLGAGSVHQAQPKGGSMGFIMPLYTVGIVAFFIYTIMKILFKKPVPNAPYGPVQTDPNFHKEVFGHDNSFCKRPEESQGPKIGCTYQHMHDSRNCGQKHANGDISSTSYSNRSAQHSLVKVTTNGVNGIAAMGRQDGQEREQLMEIEKLRIKLEETEKAMARLIAEMNCDRYKAKETSEQPPQNGNISNGHAKTVGSSEPSPKSEKLEDIKKETSELINSEQNVETPEKKKRDGSVERTVKVLGMEMTASCEGGQKWNRPPTPVFISHLEHSTDDDTEKLEPQSIYLEGALPHESQILVADSEIRTESVVDRELNGTPEEPAVILSSKMTLSLINLSSSEESDDKPRESSSDKDESPLDEDMEIINGEEKEEKTTEE